MLRNLFAIATWIVLCAALATASSGCGPVGKQAVEQARAGTIEQARAGTIDCTTAGAAALIDEFTPVVKQALDTAKVDRAAAKASLRTLGKRTGACVVATIIASGMAALTPQRLFSGGWQFEGEDPVDTANAKELFDEVRNEAWGGARYKTDAGEL